MEIGEKHEMAADGNGDAPQAKMHATMLEQVAPLISGLMEPGDDKDILLYKEIRLFTKALGIDKMPNSLLEEYMLVTFGLERSKLAATIDGVKKNVFAFLKVRFSHTQQDRIVKRNQIGLFSQAAAVAPAQAVCVGNADPVVAKIARDSLTRWQLGAVAKIETSLKNSLQALSPPPASAAADGDMVRQKGYFGIQMYAAEDGSRCIQYIYPWSNAYPALLAGQIKLHDQVISAQYNGYEYVFFLSGMSSSTRLDLTNKTCDDLSLEINYHTLYRVTVTLKRTLHTLQEDTRSLDRVFFYGGSQNDRDECIHFLQLEKANAPFCVLSMKQHHSKIANMYVSSRTQSKFVVISYDEDPVCGMPPNAVLKTITGNHKMHTEVRALSRCLMNGNYWHTKHGTVNFQPVKKIFVFCNAQPNMRKTEWKDWMFYNVSDITL